MHRLLLVATAILWVAAGEEANSVRMGLERYEEVRDRASESKCRREALLKEHGEALAQARQEAKQAERLWRYDAAQDLLGREMRTSVPDVETVISDSVERANAAVLGTRAVVTVTEGEDATAPAPHAVFEFEVDVRVRKNTWTAVPLISAGVIASEWRLGFQSDGADAQLFRRVFDSAAVNVSSDQCATAIDAHLRGLFAAWNGEGAVPYDSHDGDILYADVDAARFTAPHSSETLLTVAPLTDADTGDQTHLLLTRRAGLHRVRFAVHTAVRTANKMKKDLHVVGLSNLHFPLSAVTFRVVGSAAAPPKVADVTTAPAGAYHNVSYNSTASVVALLPRTRSVEIKWRMGVPEAAVSEKDDQDDSAPASHAKKPPAVTVRHEALHSLLDGNLIASFHALSYAYDQEQATPTAVVRVCPREARVIAVAAQGLESWDVAPDTTDTGCSAVRMRFQGVVDGPLQIHINTELDFSEGSRGGGPDTADVALPSLVCDGVLRQSGTIAVAKASSIEVDEESLPRGVSRIGIEDLSESLRYRASSGPPLVLSYKYKNAAATQQGGKEGENGLVLSVRAHEQVALLDAIVEAMHGEVLVLENGRTLHKYILQVQNQKRQYLRLRKLPKGAKVWSLSVNSVAVRPVLETDAEGEGVLIPLLVGLPTTLTTAPGKGLPKTSVEIVYVSENGFVSSDANPEGRVESVDVTAPLVEALPVQGLTMVVETPKGYSTFYTSAPRTPAALAAAPSAIRKRLEDDSTRPPAERLPRPAELAGPLDTPFTLAIPKPISHTKGRKVVPKNYAFGPADEHPSDSDSEGGGRPAGGLKIDIKQGGQKAHFERLLLENDQAHLAVMYVPEAAARSARSWLPFF